MRSAAACAWILATCAGSASSALAQDAAPPPEPAFQRDAAPADLEPYEGRPVRRVILETPPAEAGGLPGSLDEATLALCRNQLRLRAGAPFVSGVVTEDVSRLNRLGRFRSVEARVRQHSDGWVDVVFRVSPQPVIEAVQVVGNKRLDDNAILGMVEILNGTPVDPTQLDRACRRIEERYLELGYYNCRVSVDEKELTANRIVVFRVREGDRTKITGIRFEGNNAFTGGELRQQIKTNEARFLGFFKGRLDGEQIVNDAAALVGFYRDRGYLDVRTDRIVTPSPDGSEAIVTFVIDEGPLYTLRGVRITYEGQGTPLFSPEQLLSLMKIRPGDAYGLKVLNQSIEDIRRAYWAEGYPDVAIDRRELRDEGSPQVDLALLVREGRQFRFGEVTIQGNPITQDSVIRRHLYVQPDRPADPYMLAESETKLRQTRLFAIPNPNTPDARPPKLTLLPEDENNPGYRDVLVEVEETNTGSFNIGAALGSDSGLSARIAVTQRNFDITNPPASLDDMWVGEGFRGGGQIFNLTLSPGDEASNYSVGLTEPNVFDSDYSFGGTLYYRTREYDDWDERRYGIQFSAGRRFGDRWRGSIPLRFENVDVGSFEDDAPTDYYDVEDARWIASLGFELTRASTDNPTRPTKGTYTELGIYQYGGEDTWNRFYAEHRIFLPVWADYMDRKTVLTLTGKLGFIPQDQDDVPYYERMYMGGRSFRGFDFRTISPRGVRFDNGEPSDDPIGGTFQFFLGAEIEQPVFEDIFSVVAFVDSGTVQDGIGFDEYRVSVGIGARFYIEALSSVPLAFDLGYPILKQDGDEEELFSFSLDLPFR